MHSRHVSKWASRVARVNRDRVALASPLSMCLCVRWKTQKKCLTQCKHITRGEKEREREERLVGEVMSVKLSEYTAPATREINCNEIHSLL